MLFLHRLQISGDCLHFLFQIRRSPLPPPPTLPPYFSLHVHQQLIKTLMAAEFPIASTLPLSNAVAAPDRAVQQLVQLMMVMTVMICFYGFCGN